MRKVIAFAIVASALGAAVLGHADEPLVLEGTIEIGTLGENSTQADAACDPSSDANGFDGVWFAAAGQDGRDALLEYSGDNASVSDADVYFYDESCAQIEDDSMAQNFIALGRSPFETNVEAGSVPEGTAFIFVSGFFGVDIHFSLTISDPVVA